jgi:hypothetical protein
MAGRKNSHSYRPYSAYMAACHHLRVSQLEGITRKKAAIVHLIFLRRHSSQARVTRLLFCSGTAFGLVASSSCSCSAGESSGESRGEVLSFCESC